MACPRGRPFKGISNFTPHGMSGSRVTPRRFDLRHIINFFSDRYSSNMYIDAVVVSNPPKTVGVGELIFVV